jgi:hypothetical protein
MPTMPKTWVTPQLTIVSTPTSEIVRVRGSSAGSATYTPSGRTSSRKLNGASVKPGGDEPFARRVVVAVPPAPAPAPAASPSRSSLAPRTALVWAAILQFSVGTGGMRQRD